MSRQRPPTQPPSSHPSALELEMRETLENLKEFALMMSFRASIGSLTIHSVEPERPGSGPRRTRAQILRLPPPGTRR